jgi:hypothetical protein
LIGKAEASSAGEQLARNNLSDWNGQGQGEMFWPFFVSFQEFMPLKNSFRIYADVIKNSLLSTVHQACISVFNSL